MRRSGTMPLAPLTPEQYADHLVKLHEEMKQFRTPLDVYRHFMAGKGSLLGESSLSVLLRRSLLESYRIAEVRLFGELTELPYERELLKHPLVHPVPNEPRRFDFLAEPMDESPATIPPSTTQSQSVETPRLDSKVPKPNRVPESGHRGRAYKI